MGRVEWWTCVAAWDAISPRLAASGRRSERGDIVGALPLAIQVAADSRNDERRKPAHERAVDVTLTLADLGMDAGVSAGLPGGGDTRDGEPG